MVMQGLFLTLRNSAAAVSLCPVSFICFWSIIVASYVQYVAALSSSLHHSKEILQIHICTCSFAWTLFGTGNKYVVPRWRRLSRPPRPIDDRG